MLPDQRTPRLKRLTHRPYCTARRLLTAAFALLAAAVPGYRAAAQTIVDGGQTLNISSDQTYSSGLVVGNTSTSTVNQTGGTVTAPSTSFNSFTLGSSTTGVGYYNFSGQWPPGAP